MATVIEANGPYSERTDAVAAEARLRIKELVALIQAHGRLFWLVVALVLVFVAIDLGVAFNFNQAIVLGDVREEPSLADQLARLFASLMMVCVVCAAVFGWHIATRGLVNGWLRMLSALTATVLAVGGGLVAAAIAYPILGELLVPVLTGSTALPTGFADGAGTPAPLWARLLCASPVIAAGLLVAMLEIKALYEYELLTAFRREHARCAEIIALDDLRLEKKARQEELQAQREAEEKADMAEAFERRFNAVMAYLIQMILSYAQQIKSVEPTVRDKAVLSADAYAQQNARIDEHKACVGSIKQVLEAAGIPKPIPNLVQRVREALTATATRVD